MIYFNKATDYYNKKDYKKALSMYKKALELKENESASLYNSAVCLIKLKEYEKAIPFIKEAIKTKIDSRYFFNLGYCYAMLRDKKKALMYFNRAWALNYDDVDCEKAITLILNGYKKFSF
ncbi:tetratricopeptide repeat protein [Clostridium felsineum]|uniref:Uncharacterized protein n=1 Tax=Clostridium felsineum TaxID=36839 RepID=A0A1S8MCH8_9CLOT|nr:tetratricopeptide repeat protein [Clostridium felsineum]MCR3761223.1 tetratricopeptide repeat protein [Clostridium felsineum]URZ00062.1 hypothetical protein CLAUR_000450 [Clostridium felsineum]URZ07293.1 hypothetical protein CLROS_026310 [Clostridium felsineum]URZ12324.1 hypothetical protein CROST_030460 [Clostridium felsineum]